MVLVNRSRTARKSCGDDTEIVRNMHGPRNLVEVVGEAQMFGLVT